MSVSAVVGTSASRAECLARQAAEEQAVLRTGRPGGEQWAKLPRGGLVSVRFTGAGSLGLTFGGVAEASPGVAIAVVRAGTQAAAAQLEKGLQLVRFATGDGAANDATCMPYRSVIDTIRGAKRPLRLDFVASTSSGLVDLHQHVVPKAPPPRSPVLAPDSPDLHTTAVADKSTGSAPPSLHGWGSECASCLLSAPVFFKEWERFRCEVYCCCGPQLHPRALEC